MISVCSHLVPDDGVRLSRGARGSYWEDQPAVPRHQEQSQNLLKENTFIMNKPYFVLISERETSLKPRRFSSHGYMTSVYVIIVSGLFWQSIFESDFAYVCARGIDCAL